MIKTPRLLVPLRNIVININNTTTTTEPETETEPVVDRVPKGYVVVKLVSDTASYTSFWYGETLPEDEYSVTSSIWTQSLNGGQVAYMLIPKDWYFWGMDLVSPNKLPFKEFFSKEDVRYVQLKEDMTLHTVSDLDAPQEP